MQQRSEVDGGKKVKKVLGTSILYTVRIHHTQAVHCIYTNKGQGRISDNNPCLPARVSDVQRAFPHKLICNFFHDYYYVVFSA